MRAAARLGRRGARAATRADRARSPLPLMHADLAVRLQPRARREELVGEREGAVVIRVTAPPVDGKANAALEAFLAAKAGVPKSAVSVIRGHASRDKLVRVSGIEQAALRQMLGLAPAG
jgi:uncharacterized protein (TIGR00251 family)